MSKLDNFLQSAGRNIEALVVKLTPQNAQEGEGVSEPMAGPDFGSLLQVLSNQPDEQPKRGQRANLDMPPASVLSDYVKTAFGELKPADPERKRATDGTPAAGAEALMLEQAIALALTRPEAPPALNATPRTAMDPSPSSAVQTEPSLSDLMEPLLSDGGEADIVRSLTAAPVLKASVVHQETHFKPILPGPMFSIAKQPAADVDNGTAPAGLAADTEALSLGKPELVPVVSRSETSRQSRDGGGISLPMPAENEGKDKQGTLPASVFQKIADSVIAEAGPPEAKPDLKTHKAEAPLVITVKSSDGVVRVLNIQLHPVELGLVTVKMRLAGDKLEMELIASSDETAKLLKSDSDKLSSLLRASGYRPDIITIQSNGSEITQQDNSSGQRQQFSSQSQQQSNGSHQGASNSGDQPRRQSETSEQGRGRSGPEENSPRALNTDSLYL